MLVDDNPNYKRYRFVMKKRHQVNINYTGTDLIQTYKTEDRGLLDVGDIKEYLEREYGEDQFDPRNTLMSKQERKIKVGREGKETDMNVYQRS